MRLRYAWRVLTTAGFVTSQLRDLQAHFSTAFRSDPFAHAYRTVRPFTMSGPARLRALYEAVEHVSENGIPGSIMECGAARGGSSALLGIAIKNTGGGRTLWVLDTFEGIPAPTRSDPDHEIAAPYTGRFRGEIADVASLLDRVGILDHAELVKGRFEDTIPRLAPGPIAVLHIDGDWYSSVKVCLDYLYDRVAPGGIIQIDDYGHWEGARKAVDEFLAARKITEPLRYVDYSGRQLIKQ
jgi:predicted O-methyltransferase YrrM